MTQWTEANRSDRSTRDPVAASLERKIARAQFSIFIERIWPRCWLLIGLVLTFVLLSMLDVWSLVTPAAHRVLLGGFCILAAAALIWIARTPWPDRGQGLRAIEQTSGVAHRPATALGDTVANAPEDSAARKIWHEHRRRMFEKVKRLRVAPPNPRTDKSDPFAARAALLLAAFLAVGFAGHQAGGRLMAAFDLDHKNQLVANTRVDAWITPPSYTARAPIILADGGRPVSADAAASRSEVPENSVLTVRTSASASANSLSLRGLNAAGATVVETVEPDGESAIDEAETADSPQNGTSSKPASSGLADATLVLAPGITRVVALLNGSEIADWPVTVIPDQAPTISMTKDMETTIRGGMKLFYQVQDDYGIAVAEARFKPLPPDEEDPRTQWARPDLLTGPRLPLMRPPQVRLRLPPRNSKDGKIWSFHEIGSHPWAGMRVEMTLVAKDHAGNTGQSKPVAIKLPERLFRNPLARAVVEQRRNLVIDPRYRELVVKALDALTMAPDGFIRDLAVYTGLRHVRYKLDQDKTRVGINEAIDQLWHIARRIEDGRGLSDAERRLREIQEQLSKAIENGASDEEIKRLMQELRQALAEFMNQLARQAEQMPQQQMQQGSSPNQMLTQEDLNRMMQDLENMARQGSRDQAQEMLSQLRDLIDRLQSGRMARQGQQGQQSRQMQEMMNQFGDIIGRQQRLMDDTFGAQRQQGQQGEQGQQGQQGQRGQQGQQGQRGQNGQAGRGQNGRGQLGQRQGQLGQRLDQLQRGMNGLGMQAPGQLDGARESMENAQRALEQGDLETATEEQARALEQLRQGAQSMARQMMQQMPSRYGRAGDAPLDPLGRPQRSDGPDTGSSVKVPGEIETQRAREILEELRRRLGQPLRPEIELDYIERLLKRF